MNRLKCSVLLFFILWSPFTGCNLTANYVLEERALQSPNYVVISPPKRLELPCVQAFLKFKRQQGFRVQILKIDLLVEMKVRCLKVQAGLRAISSSFDGEAGYALILATPDELTMGPWKFEGLERPRSSDVPYFLGVDCSPAKEIPESTWENLLKEGHPWNTGRIPYQDKELLAGIFQSTKRYFSLG